MRTDSRLSRMLHFLSHMARATESMTSVQIGSLSGKNAVVVRRTMAGLRKVGHVDAEKGRRGGWCNA